MNAGTGAALARCVADPEAFLTAGWGGRPLHSPGVDSGAYADLLSLDDVDHLVTAAALRAPAFRLVRGGRPLPPSRYLRHARVGSRLVDDLIDPGRVLAAFHDGATIVLQGLQRYWSPLAAFCRDLELTLTHPVQANAYVTPPEAAGLRVHADEHDVFALQTFGRKHWTVPGDDGDGPWLDTVLEPGDALYLPAGVRHVARTPDRPSVHITVGVRASTWAELLRGVVTQALEDPELAGRLPAGYAHDADALADAVGGRLRALAAVVGALDPGALADAAIRRFAAGRPPPLRGALGDLLGLEAIDDDTRVTRRPGTTCHLALSDDGGMVMTLGDRTLRLPGHTEAPVRRIVDTPAGAALRPRDLAGHLDEAGRLVLVRRLVREGLLTLADGDAAAR